MIPPLCHNIVITIATSGGSCNIYFMFLGKYVVSRLGATEGWWFSQETMFMAELDNLLLTAGHDWDRIKLPLCLDIGKGDEKYVALNGREVAVKSGDMFIADSTGVISSIIGGPDQRTRITSATQCALFTVYAPPGIGAAAVRKHLQDIRAYVLIIAPRAEVEALEIHCA